MKLRRRELKDLSRIIQLESHCPIELLVMVEISVPSKMLTTRLLRL